LTETDEVFRRFQIEKFNKKRISPSFSLSLDIDITKLNKIRKNQKERITLSPILIYAITKNLVNFKILYAFFNGRKIIYNSDVVLNIPVGVENHVEYIILKNPDKNTFSELLNLFNEELKKIKKGEGSFKKKIERIMKIPKIIRKIGINLPGYEIKFLRENYGNFIITNVGTLGMKTATLTMMKPIVSTMIIGKIQEVNSKEILPVTLFFDHRVVDAGYASRFLNSVKKELEKSTSIYNLLALH